MSKLPTILSISSELCIDFQFHIEEHHQSVCPYDKLMIEDEEKKFGPFCGRDSPKKYRAASNWLIVEFFSDASEGHKGFKAKYWLERKGYFSFQLQLFQLARLSHFPALFSFTLITILFG